MNKVVKYLKPYGQLLILAIILLFGQAVSDLSLPNYMSDIVNIGIQKSGIEEPAPKAISTKALGLLSLFMTEEDAATTYESYELIKVNSSEAKKYVDTYPLLKSEDIYVIKKEAPVKKLGSIYGRATYGLMSSIQYLSNEQDRARAGSEGDLDLTKADFNSLYKLYPVLSSMPKDTLQGFISTGQKADEYIYSQVATTFTKVFYAELGADVNAMRNSYILKTGLMMLLVTLLGAAATIAVGFLAARIGAALAKTLRRDVFTKVESFSNSEFDKFSTASLITRTTNDITQVQMLTTMGIRMMAYAPILGIGGIIMALRKSLSLSWIIALAIIVISVVILIIFNIAVPKFKAVQKLVDRLNLVTREGLSGIMVIRAFGNQGYQEERFEEVNENLTVTSLFVNRVIVFLIPFMMLLMNLTTLVIVWVGAHQIESSRLLVGDMMAFIQYAMQIIGAFLMIAIIFILVPRASVSLTRIGEVLDTKPVIVEKSKAVTFKERPKGSVQFKNVSFRYSEAEEDVLKNISFLAEPGKTTAFIGSTGAGKTTLINLIPRFYDATEGEILIDGINVKDFSLHELREIIGYVPQKGVLFSGTIDSNIRFGRQEANEEEVTKAAEVAQALEFIRKTEKGVGTDISQGGANVSGGQKQRLAIARALVKKPPIYIFDDSFSALDFKTDAALRKALKKYTGDSTVLIVAQRISTIMNAEQIVVLDEGRVVGIGRHSELLQNCSTYREIAESQLSEEELA